MPHTNNAMSHTVVIYGRINMSIYVIHKLYKSRIMLCMFRQTIHCLLLLLVDNKKVFRIRTPKSCNFKVIFGGID